MKKALVTFLLSFMITVIFAQSSKSILNLQRSTDTASLIIQQLYHDSLASSFVLWIKKEVKPHKHIHHTEHVYIIDGEGEMKVGNEQLKVKAGDLVFIPKNTVHSLKVTSAVPVKVISIQSPYFDGTDRVMVE